MEYEVGTALKGLEGFNVVPLEFIFGFGHRLLSLHKGY